MDTAVDGVGTGLSIHDDDLMVEPIAIGAPRQVAPVAAKQPVPALAPAPAPAEDTEQNFPSLAPKGKKNKSKKPAKEQPSQNKPAQAKAPQNKNKSKKKPAAAPQQSGGGAWGSGGSSGAQLAASMAATRNSQNALSNHAKGPGRQKVASARGRK